MKLEKLNTVNIETIKDVEMKKISGGTLPDVIVTDYIWQGQWIRDEVYPNENNQ